jgi:hypothetical protein
MDENGRGRVYAQSTTNIHETMHVPATVSLAPNGQVVRKVERRQQGQRRNCLSTWT